MFGQVRNSDGHRLRIQGADVPRFFKSVSGPQKDDNKERKGRMNRRKVRGNKILQQC